MNKYNYDYIANKKKFFSFSIILMVIVLAFTLFKGVALDIQFKGGTIVTYSYENELDITKVTEQVNSVNKDSATVKQIGDLGENKKQINVSFAASEGLTPEEVISINTSLQENFKDNNIKQEQINNVTPSIGQDFFMKSIVAVIFAALMMILYITIRFRKIGGLPAGIMAVVALLHDIIIVFGVFVILGFPIDNNFIAVVLTIFGYSINDTIVIYDRIRENKNIYGNRKTLRELVNLSINQSLTRSINTTVSTVMALSTVCIVAIFFNVPSIITFALPMIIGMISGVYSTIFIAGPLWVTYEEYKSKKIN